MSAFGGVVCQGSVPIAVLYGYEVELIVGLYGLFEALGAAPFGPRRKAGYYGYLRRHRADGRSYRWRRFVLPAKSTGYLGVQMSARFLERVNVNAGAKVDDLYAVLACT